MLPSVHEVSVAMPELFVVTVDPLTSNLMSAVGRLWS